MPAFSGNSCPDFNPKGYLSEFFAYHVFKGTFIDIEDPRVIQAEADFQEKYAGGIAGRPRKSLSDDCTFID